MVAVAGAGPKDSPESSARALASREAKSPFRAVANAGDKTVLGGAMGTSLSIEVSGIFEEAMIALVKSTH